MTLRERTGATELNVDVDLVRMIVVKGRAALAPVPDAEAAAPEMELELDRATTVTKEDPAQLAEERADDQTQNETAAMIDSLSADEQAEVIALTLIGRGDFEPVELEAAVRLAKEDATGPASDRLFEMDIFPSHLANGLDAYEAWRAKQPG
ncbi:MAG: DUF3775 domain-containing protein [Pseudomonadota bacterium]